MKALESIMRCSRLGHVVRGQVNADQKPDGAASAKPRDYSRMPSMRCAPEEQQAYLAYDHVAVRK